MTSKACLRLPAPWASLPVADHASRRSYVPFELQTLRMPDSTPYPFKPGLSAQVYKLVGFPGPRTRSLREPANISFGLRP